MTNARTFLVEPFDIMLHATEEGVQALQARFAPGERRYAAKRFVHQRILSEDVVLGVDVHPGLRPGIEEEAVLALLADAGPGAAGAMRKAVGFDGPVEFGDDLGQVALDLAGVEEGEGVLGSRIVLKCHFAISALLRACRM